MTEKCIVNIVTDPESGEEMIEITEDVRDALGLKMGDDLEFRMLEDGTVELRKAEFKVSVDSADV
jgi:AbrB family looped-hinge helix DNA binding protein